VKIARLEVHLALGAGPRREARRRTQEHPGVTPVAGGRHPRRAARPGLRRRTGRGPANLSRQCFRSNRHRAGSSSYPSSRAISTASSRSAASAASRASCHRPPDRFRPTCTATCHCFFEALHSTRALVACIITTSTSGNSLLAPGTKGRPGGKGR
jgi:hypothetical protein